jgi:hypothetical protein
VGGDIATGANDRAAVVSALGQSVFDVEGDEAWGETFFVMHTVFGGRTACGFGRYVDYFRRIDARWKVVYRRVCPTPPFSATAQSGTGSRAATEAIRDTTG